MIICEGLHLSTCLAVWLYMYARCKQFFVVDVQCINLYVHLSTCMNDQILPTLCSPSDKFAAEEFLIT